jgi:DNA-binding MarR family transcriptional regulator
MLREGGPQTQQALATTMRVDPTNLVGLLNDLEGDGLIERLRQPEDRRRHIVALTDAGLESLAEAEAALAAAENDILAALDDEQRQTLHALLQLAGPQAVSVPTQDG